MSTQNTEDLKSRVDAEAVQFRELIAEFDELKQDLVALRQRRLDVEQIAQEVRQTHGLRMRELLETLPQGKETLRETLVELRQLSNAFSESWKSVESASEQAVKEAVELGEAVSGKLVEQSGELLGHLGATLGKTKDSLATMVREDLCESILHTSLNGIEQIGNQLTECKETVQGSLDSVVTETKERIEEMNTEIVELMEQWDHAVADIEDDYENLVQELSRLKDDVVAMMNSVRDALNGTGLGFDAASGALQNVTVVMNTIC